MAVEAVFVLEGPARRIFEQKLGAVVVQTMDDAVHMADAILTGTSWQSDLELAAIAKSRLAGKRCTTFLDHWVNYRQRFTRDRAVILPDEIWVGDAIAEARAREAFPRIPVCLIENPYFADLREELARTKSDGEPGRAGLSILYVCEPVRDHALRQEGDERAWGYTEEEALRYFLSNAGVLGSPIERVVIRPHPSEPVDKYHCITNEFSLPIVPGGAATLVEEIVKCDVVVGCESVAMVVGLLAGKRVVSSIPPGGRPCALPQSQILHLQHLL
jgi:hypothetical protein